MKSAFEYLITDHTGRVGLLIGKRLSPVGNGSLAQPVVWIETGDPVVAAQTAAHLAAALALYDDITHDSGNHDMTILAATHGFAHWRCTSKDSNRNWRRRDGVVFEFTGGGTLWEALSSADAARPYTSKKDNDR